MDPVIKNQTSKQVTSARGMFIIVQKLKLTEKSLRYHVHVCQHWHRFVLLLYHTRLVNTSGDRLSFRSRLRDIIFRYLLSPQQRPLSVNDIMPMIGARFYTQLDAALHRCDVIENELAKVIFDSSFHAQV